MGERLPEALRISALELLRQQNLLGDTGAARLAAISRAGIGVPPPATTPVEPPTPAAENLLAGQSATAANFRTADASVYVASVFGSTAGPALRDTAAGDRLRPVRTGREAPLPVEEIAELRGEELELETERREIESRQARIPEEVVEDQLARLEAMQARLREIDQQLSAYGASGAARPSRFQHETAPIGAGKLFRALI